MYKVFNNPERVEQRFKFNPFGVVAYFYYYSFPRLHRGLFKFNPFGVVDCLAQCVDDVAQRIDGMAARVDDMAQLNDLMEYANYQLAARIDDISINRLATTTNAL